MKKNLLLAIFCGVSLMAQSQNFQPQTQLFSSDIEAGDSFGYSIAVNGDYAIVGASADQPTGVGTNTFGQGAAYLFKRDESGNWNEVQKLAASNGESNDVFGRSVAISDEYIAIGAYQEEDAGAVYVFTKNAVSGIWEESFIIRSTDSRSGDQFGNNVNISGDQIIVGVQAKRSVDPLDISGTISFTGTVFVFQYNPTFDDWNQIQKIEGDDADEFTSFGLAVDVEGDHMVVGAQTEDLDENEANELNNAGAAYFYERNGSGQWNETQKIAASNRGVANAFGYSVAISGDRALIGTFARSAINDGQQLPDDVVRAAYIFEKNQSNTWTETNILTAPDEINDLAFGYQVNLDDSLATVSGSSNVYVFSKDNSGDWPEIQQLTAPVFSSFSFGFGLATAIHEKELLIAEHGFSILEEDGFTIDKGSAGTVNVFRNQPVIRYSGMGFSENVFNDGSLIGSIELTVALDTFATTGTTLTTPTDYTIDNLPDGFTPVVTVDASGLSATLTISGNATNSQTIDDISDLTFSFQDAAFKSGDAALVTNAVNGSSNLGITYIDGLPSILNDTIILADENTEAGILVDLASSNGDSEELDQDITYSIGTGGDHDFYTIDTETGEISSTTIFDFENPADQNMDNDYVLNITISDGTNDSTQNFYVRVRDANEFPEFISDNQTFVDENTSGLVQDINATDGDTGAEDENLTYSILEQFDHAFFTISSTTGEVTLTEMLDFENPQDEGRDNNYLIEVNASDGVNVTPFTFVYTIEDVNELPLLEDREVFTNENVVNGSIILQANLLFPDPEDDELSYSIINGNDSNTFAIEATTGELSVSDSTDLDFELNPVFTLNVEVTDGSLTDTFLINVNLRDVNEPVVIEDATFTIDENPANGSVVGQIIAFDPDSDISYFIAAGDNDNTFAISETGELSVNDSTLIDFEINPVFTLTVQASSSGSNVEATVTINVNDVVENSAPTDITLSGNLISEGQPIGTVVGELNTTDTDEGDSHIYTLSGTDADQFSIVGNELSSAAIVDYSTNQSLDITITTSDAMGASFSKEITIEVNSIPSEQTPLETILLEEGFVEEIIDISNLFSDEDGDELVITVTEETSGIVNAIISETNLILQEVASGATNITLTATDDDGETASTVVGIVISIPLSVEPSLTIHILPNPTAEYFKVEGAELSQVIVLDTNGRILKKSTSNHVNISDLASGLYLVKATDKQGNIFIERLSVK